MLELVGWSVQDAKDLDFTASRGVALREFPLEAGFADYMFFVDRQAVGIVEAKKEGTTLGGVATQSKKYLDGLPAHVQRVGTPLPFAYESTGVETVFRDVRDPDYRSRRVFWFHRPETLLGWARDVDTLRARLKEMPPLATAGLRECQVEAIERLERSLSENRPRSLIQMATGSGKTFTAVSFSYKIFHFERIEEHDASLLNIGFLCAVQTVEEVVHGVCRNRIRFSLESSRRPDLSTVHTAWEFESLIGAMHLQMWWLMASAGDITRCEFCGRIVSLARSSPGGRKHRRDKRFCDDACRQAHHRSKKKP
jgi:hypothetical protein